MRNYEIVVVLHPDLEIDLENALKKVEKIFESENAKIDKKDNWGKRKLAYTINKQNWGIYIVYNLSIEPLKVREINEKLRIAEEIMRYLIVSLEDIRYLRPANTSKVSTAKKEEVK